MMDCDTAWHLENFRDDCVKLQGAILEHEGLSLSLETCARIWENYSEDFFCASWLCMPERFTATNCIEMRQYISYFANIDAEGLVVGI